MVPEAEIAGRKIYVTLTGLSATSANQRVWTPPTKDANARFRLNAASARWGTASSSAKLQLEVATGNTALGSGVSQLDTALDTSATADVPVHSGVSNPTLFGNTDSLNLTISGTKTSLADCVVCLEIEKVR